MQTFDFDVDQFGVRGHQRLGADADAVGDAGAEVLDEHVGVDCESTDRIKACVGAQVDGEAALASVGRGERRGHLAHGRAGPAVAIADGALFDLHDVGTEIREQHPGQRAGDHLARLEHPEAGEWSLTEIVGHAAEPSCLLLR